MTGSGEGSKKRHGPRASAEAEGHLSMRCQKTGSACVPAVLFSSVTATSMRQTSDARCSFSRARACKWESECMRVCAVNLCAGKSNARAVRLPWISTGFASSNRRRRSTHSTKNAQYPGSSSIIRSCATRSAACSSPDVILYNSARAASSSGAAGPCVQRPAEVTGSRAAGDAEGVGGAKKRDSRSAASAMGFRWVLRARARGRLLGGRVQGILSAGNCRHGIGAKRVKEDAGRRREEEGLLFQAPR